MAKLYFTHSAMNSGKSTELLQTAYNYEERGMETIIIKSDKDTKGGDQIVSRLGVSRKVDVYFPEHAVLPELIDESRIKRGIAKSAMGAVLADEIQFCTPKQVDELFWFAVDQDIPVLMWGLRTDFKFDGFPGSTRALEIAHEIREKKTICRCGKKATLNGRKLNGVWIFEGEQVAIDGNEYEYESLCADCYLRAGYNKG